MFFIVGTKDRKVKVEGGIRQKKYCPQCGREQMFEEVQWVKHCSLFFVPLFPVQGKKSITSVMACPDCNTSYHI